MNNHRILIHNRNQLMAKLMWFFLFLSILVNGIVDPAILVVIIPTGLFCCLVASVFVAKKWLVTQTPVIIVTVIFLFFITLVLFEPLLINFVYIWFALILSSIYQQYKPILLAGIYSLGFTIYIFYNYHAEVFPFTDQEDIVYLGLFSVFVTIFLIYASKFNEKLQEKLQQEKMQQKNCFGNLKNSRW
ncbi:hypothetical protein H1D32_21530 [Anaerobacillus sp. CMMVII]|uniref:hypothetical protein n=1 Tax=Anaerobacillus sp. CMMVII TaxID=2755588 RepID=UPI0021B78AAE|nr:hypothetical protein [Anaerobacillus sp. CMMVII]MCT8140041.1 hypothetical protein [Anaerobacillus sp. CMMVII]